MCIEIGCGVKKQCMLHFRLHAKTRTSKFCKVVRQHTEGMIGNIAWILLEIYFSFHQWKNFENPLRIDKVIAMSLVYDIVWRLSVESVGHLGRHLEFPKELEEDTWELLVCYSPYYFASFLKISACYQFFQPLAKYELRLLAIALDRLWPVQ